jgi:lipopolysaccharide/colanic/teichoic acid biosynthesis glycosyltransferase
MKTRLAQRLLKRLTDVAASAAGLAGLAPVMSMVALAVFLRMGRPVLFRQVRPGLRERPFTLYKFRTMAETRGPEGRALPDGARLTALGRALRRWSLDELPQLWNVLRGDMSLVGPRPLLTEYLDRYTPEQRRRHEARPGITGWAQVNGRNAITWEEKFEYDVWYVGNWNLWLDLRILLSTLAKAARGEGISRSGSTTMPEFLGTGDASDSDSGAAT